VEKGKRKVSAGGGESRIIQISEKNIFELQSRVVLQKVSVSKQQSSALVRISWFVARKLEKSLALRTGEAGWDVVR
jgi:hypothetical protein